MREAALDDVDSLLRIEATAFPGDRLDRRQFRHAIRSPTIHALVLGEPGAVTGYVLVETRRGSGTGRVSSLAVAPDASGRGLGRALLAAAETAARAAGCRRLRLEVRADNGRAARLYRSAGFRPLATLPGYYEDGEAAARYEKDLDIL